MLLPPQIFSEATLKEVSTLQLDYIPPEHCNVQSVRKILSGISREIPQFVTKIAVRQLCLYVIILLEASVGRHLKILTQNESH